MIVPLLMFALQTAGAKCSVPNADAAVAVPATPVYPARANRAAGTAKVIVVVAADGKPVSEKVLESSGNMAIDQAALQAAKHSTYRPKIVNCKPVRGSYLFVVSMNPQ